MHRCCINVFWPVWKRTAVLWNYFWKRSHSSVSSFCSGHRNCFLLELNLEPAACDGAQCDTIVLEWSNCKWRSACWRFGNATSHHGSVVGVKHSLATSWCWSIESEEWSWWSTAREFNWLQSWTSVGHLQPHDAELEDWSSDTMLRRTFCWISRPKWSLRRQILWLEMVSCVWWRDNCGFNNFLCLVFSLSPSDFALFEI